MKLIKYFFTIPFSPVQEWKKVYKEMDESQNLREDAIFLFLVMTALSIGYTFLFDVYRGGNLFTFETVLIEYFSLIALTFMTMFGIKIFGNLFDLGNMENTKLFIVIVLATGFVNFLSNFVFLFLDAWLFYNVLGYYFLRLGIYVVLAILLVFGLLPNKNKSNETTKLESKLPGILFITVILIGVNVIFHFGLNFILRQYYYLFG